MSDNTKLKPALRYSSVLGCIIGSTLSIEQTKINAYEDIQPIINKIKTEKAIAKYVRAYILQVIYLFYLFKFFNYNVNSNLLLLIIRFHCQISLQ